MDLIKRIIRAIITSIVFNTLLLLVIVGVVLLEFYLGNLGVLIFLMSLVAVVAFILADPY